MRLEDLAVLVLEVQRPRAVEDAGDAPGHRGAVLAALEPEAAGLDADEAGVGVEEAGEGAHRVRPAADARDDDVGVARRGSPGTARALRRPTTRWNSRTIHGNGCGPTTEPMQ